MRNGEIASRQLGILGNMAAEKHKATMFVDKTLARDEKIWSFTMIGVAIVMLLAIIYVSLVLHGTLSDTFEIPVPMPNSTGQEIGANGPEINVSAGLS